MLGPGWALPRCLRHGVQLGFNGVLRDYRPPSWGGYFLFNDPAVRLAQDTFYTSFNTGAVYAGYYVYDGYAQDSHGNVDLLGDSALADNEGYIEALPEAYAGTDETCPTVAVPMPAPTTNCSGASPMPVATDRSGNAVPPSIPAAVCVPTTPTALTTDGAGNAWELDLISILYRSSNPARTKARSIVRDRVAIQASWVHAAGVRRFLLDVSSTLSGESSSQTRLRPSRPHVRGSRGGRRDTRPGWCARRARDRRAGRSRPGSKGRWR
jgi:hypothetical protein